MALGLVAVGGAVGGTLGAGLLAALGLLIDGPGGFPYVWDAFLLARILGGFLGALGLPLLAWGLLRNVSLGRVLAYTAAGTVLGSAVGLVGSQLDPVAAVGGGSTGFCLAEVGLRRRSTRALATRRPETGAPAV